MGCTAFTVLCMRLSKRDPDVSSELLRVIQFEFSWPRNGLAEVGKMIVSSLPSKERVVKKSAD